MVEDELYIILWILVLCAFSLRRGGGLGLVINRSRSRDIYLTAESCTVYMCTPCVNYIEIYYTRVYRG